MYNFGSSATFFYYPQGTPASGTYLYLDESKMPQYPFEVDAVTDRKVYRAMSGKAWVYQNYKMSEFKFNWANLDPVTIGSFQRMVDSRFPCVFVSGGTTWGTFIITSEFAPKMVLYDLYDFNLTMEGAG